MFTALRVKDKSVCGVMGRLGESIDLHPDESSFNYSMRCLWQKKTWRLSFKYVQIYKSGR